MKDLKPPCTLKEQIKILRGRNLIIEDEDYAEQILNSVSYYRLSAYGLGLHENDIFKDNTRFETIYRLYEFDVRIRYVLMQAIEITEIMFRAKIAYHMAGKYGSESYLDVQFSQSPKYHNDFVEIFIKEKNRQRNTAFVKHHENIYGGKMPIWVAVEIFSFGMLSCFYSNMKIEDQGKIAKYLGTTPVFIRSWLKCLVDIRNICAHYGRIYNRVLSSDPKLYLEHQHIDKRRIFAIILVLKRLASDLTMRQTFISEIKTLIEEYNNDINLQYIGFPDDWSRLLGEYIESK